MKTTGSWISEIWTQKAAEDYYYQQMNKTYTQPPICKQFGCGKPLKPIEQLYGNYCFKHSPNITMRQENLYEPGCKRTFTGKYVKVMDPQPETICIEDIAHALSTQVRWGGMTMEPFSIGQHSLWCSYLATDEHKLAALLHDASEAYIYDIDPHLKANLEVYQALETKYMTIIAEIFGFQYPLHPYVKKIDTYMLQQEWDCLMLGNNNDIPIYDWHKTKIFFMNEFKRLKAG